MSATNGNPLAPWVATVPPHWQIRRLGFAADVILSNVDKHTLEGELPVQLCNYTDVYKNDRVTSATEFMQASALPREIEKFQVRKGDVLATKDSEDPNDIAVSALIAEDLPGVLCGYHLAILRPDPRQLCGHFLAWVQASKQIRAQYEAQATGVTRFALGQFDFKEVVVPLPPVTEQRRITAYLDEQTAKIDRLMEMRRRQMALLKEQRAALIQQTVTRGLNPNTPMKDSGLPWLGEVPAHWEVVHLKRLLSLVEYGISERVDVEGKFICLRMGDLNFGEISYDGVAFVDAVDEGLLLRKGDLLFNRTNSLAQVGKVAIYRGNGEGNVTFASYLVRLRAGCDADSEYLNYLLNSEPILVWARSEAIPAIGQANLNPTRYCLLRVVKPPIEEQKAIVSYCVTISRRVEDLLFAYARQLEMLTEYRAALIHECVTGQRPLRPFDKLTAQGESDPEAART